MLVKHRDRNDHQHGKEQLATNWSRKIWTNDEEETFKGVKEKMAEISQFGCLNWSCSL